MLVEFLNSLGSMPIELYLVAMLLELLLGVWYHLTRTEKRTVLASWPERLAETSMPPLGVSPLETVTQPGPMPDRHLIALERRRSARYAIDTRVCGEIGSGAERKRMHGRSCDLSQHGMALISPSDFNVGDTLHITFTLPPCSPLELEAVIRNRRGLAYGIEFTNVTATQQASLNESIERWRFMLATEEAS